MVNAKHLAILRQGVDTWNAWREKERQVKPDLSHVNLHAADLTGVDLKGADLHDADLSLTVSVFV